MSARLACSGMGCYGMEADPLGDYVSHADYAALRAERDALADALTNVIKFYETDEWVPTEFMEQARAALALMKAADGAALVTSKNPTPSLSVIPE